tara:strand:+ start:1314 stop:2408 length:1095 start_codon:yes stop_codon:yes gene_type:complete
MIISEKLKEAILSYKLGKITKAINCFETSITENQNNELIYEGLGICYMQIGNYQKSIENFDKALKLNNKNHKSSSTLISLLSFIKPKNFKNNNILEANEKILLLNDMIKEDVPNDFKIKEILEKGNEYIEQYCNEINYSQTQIIKRKHERLDCDRHFKIFNKYSVIPKFCFSCYKIQITTKNVVELIKLYFLFNQPFIKKSNLRKCMVEIRPGVKENYKGFVYFKSPQDAAEALEILSHKINEKKIKTKSIKIKHGCSEFYEKYPDFKKINFKGEQEMNYNKVWEKFEKIVDSEQIKRSEEDSLYIGSSLNLINLSDFFIIKNWLNYAKILGDTSYQTIFDKNINTNFLNTILQKQYDFRKKEL